MGERVMAFSVLSLFNRFSPSVLRQAVLGLAALGVLAACGTTGGPGAVGPASPEQPSQIPEQPRPQTRGGLIPPFMADRAIVRVGLLLPFSTRPDEATALYRAAELALFERGHRNILLIPRDSGGGEREAEDAARSLVQDGVDVIVGPVLREGVVGAARVAQRERIPLIGLSSDRTVAAEGVYLLSFQLEDEVARIVDYAASQGVRAIAVMGPDNEYGRRVAQALRAEATARGMTVVAEALYTRDVGQAAPAVDRLTAAIAGRPVQAVLVADSGSVLRAVGAALGRAGLAGPNVRLLGTSAWGGGDLGAEAPLVGGWYVSADPSARGPFEQSFRSAYSEDPSRLSSLAYDAVSLAALLSRDAGAEGLTRREIERQEGFLGSDGIFRFRRNGTIERGWAVMEVRARSGPVAVQAAPRQFDRPAS